MKKLLLMAAALLLGGAAALAVPAKRGVKKMLTLADGTQVEATLRGDEHVHFYQADDGRVFQFQDGAYRLADRNQLTRLHAQRMAEANQRRAQRAPRRVGTAPAGGYHGTKRGLVILVEFKDVKFTYNRLTFNDYFNKVGFDLDGMHGSVHDYFLEQSYGAFDLEFDIAGPVALSENASYYSGNNTRVAQMVNDVCKAVDDEVDFTLYDWDNDGTVDQVYVIYAGYGEAQGAENTIWPHEWTVRASGRQAVVDGVKIDTYGTSCELMGNGVYNTGHIDGVGTSCHEFSHCLGLPDFYDTSDSDRNFGMGAWDLMDSGCYNGDTNGHSPSGYTAYERWFAGWLTPTELSSGTVISDMPALQDAPVAYILYNDADHNEYYLLENYQQKGFDAAGPGHGMLVLHVDYDPSSWVSNTVNTESDHQRMTIVPADNNASGATLSGDPFPGTKRKNSLTNTSTPKATLYNANIDGQKLMSKSITDITEMRSLISFTFMGGSSLDRPAGLAASGVSSSGFTAQWDAVDDATDYTIFLTQYIAGGQSTVLFEEEFENFRSSSMTDVSKTLDDYTQMPGWTGTNLFTSANKLRIGKLNAVGELQTPVFPAPVSDTIVVYISLYNAARMGTGKAELRLYPLGLGSLSALKSSGYYLVGDLENLPATSEQEPYSVRMKGVWDASYGDVCIAVVSDSKGSGVYMDYMAATDGIFTESEAPAQPLPAAQLPATQTAVEARWKCQPAALPSVAKVQRRAPREVSEVFTSSTNQYAFTDLQPANYTFMVRANGQNGLMSSWSEPFTVDLTTDIPALRQADAASSSATYDLTGRRISGNTLPRGLYIRNGRRFVAR